MRSEREEGRKERERGSGGVGWGGSCQFERPQCPLVPLHSGHVNERGAFPEEACLCTNEDVTDPSVRDLQSIGKRRKEDEEGGATASIK